MPRTTLEPAVLLACPNCSEPFGPRGELRRRFCPGCGQEILIKAPTLGEFAQQFSGAYLSTCVVAVAETVAVAPQEERA